MCWRIRYGHNGNNNKRNKSLFSKWTWFSFFGSLINITSYCFPQLEVIFKIICLNHLTNITTNPFWKCTIKALLARILVDITPLKKSKIAILTISTKTKLYCNFNYLIWFYLMRCRSRSWSPKIWRVHPFQIERKTRIMLYTLKTKFVLNDISLGNCAFFSCERGEYFDTMLQHRTIEPTMLHSCNHFNWAHSHPRTN